MIIASVEVCHSVEFVIQKQAIQILPETGVDGLMENDFMNHNNKAPNLENEYKHKDN